MATLAYVRCSTNEGKQDLARQERDIQNAVGIDTHVDFYKEFEHGDSENKKQLNMLFSNAKAGDTILVTEVSRLSRSNRQLCDVISTIKEKKLKLQILNSVTVDCRNGDIDPMTEAFVTMAGMFAQLELQMTRARVKSGMANAKAKGKQIGRPQRSVENLPEGFTKYLPLYLAKTINKQEFATLAHIARGTLNSYLKLTGQE